MGSGKVEFCRVGGVVVMNMYNVTAKLSGSWGTTKVCDIPEGFRPKDQMRQRCVVADANNDYSCGCWIHGSRVDVANFGGTGLNGSYSFSCTACWPV